MFSCLGSSSAKTCNKIPKVLAVICACGLDAVKAKTSGRNAIVFVQAHHKSSKAIVNVS